MTQFPVAPHEQPATFRERGVYVPLTTPMLMGGRVRLTGRDGLELVVPHASGGRGDYLAPWDRIADICELGVHDIRLIERIGRLRVITPGTVRQAGWHIAAEGFAGRRVQTAAKAAAAAAQAAQVLTHHHLLFALVRQIDPASLRPGPIRMDQLAPLARRAIGRLAPPLGRDSEKLLDALQTMAGLLAPLGLGQRVGIARLPTLLVTMQALRQALAAMPRATPWEDAAVGSITRTTDITLSCLTSTLGECRACTESIPELLQSWVADPAETVGWLGRAEWLADGWGWLCQIWSLAAEPAAQRRALEEIALVVPELPKEVARWSGFGADATLPAAILPARPVGEHDTASLLDATLRNETLLARAV